MNREDTKVAKRMKIRRATIDDAELLCDLAGAVQEGHLAARPDIFKPHVVTPQMITEYEAQLADANTYMYIGEADGESIGYILAQHIQRPENSYTYAMQFLHIDQMSVNLEHRSMGYGERLMQHVFELAKSLGIRTVTLNVWAFNERAAAFYERQGFAIRDMRMEAIVE